MTRKKEPKVIAAVFRDPDDAEAAYDWLVRHGHEEINVIMTAETRAVRFADKSMGKEETLAAEGAAVGGIVGTAVGATLAALAAVGTTVALPGLGLVVAGPLVAGLVGAGAGAVTGGLVGALVGWGIPEEDARAYETIVEEGGVVLGVAPRSEEDARAIEAKFRELHGELVYSG